MPKAYEVMVYHDEDGDAAVDFEVAGPFTSIAQARKAALELLSQPRWNGGGGIYAGTFDPGKLGVRPPQFEADPDMGPVRSTWDGTL